MADALGFQPWRSPNNYIVLHRNPEAQLSAWLGKSDSGVFVRGGRGEGPEALAALLAPHRAELEGRLHAPLGPRGRGGYFLEKTFPRGHVHEAAWAEIITWMTATIADYRAAFPEILGDS